MGRMQADHHDQAMIFFTANFTGAALDYQQCQGDPQAWDHDSIEEEEGDFKLRNAIKI